MKTSTILVLFCMAFVAIFAATADDISARAMVFRQQGGQWEIEPQVGLHHSTSASYRVTLEQWRGGQLLNVLLDETDSAEPDAPGCSLPYGQCKTSACWITCPDPAQGDGQCRVLAGECGCSAKCGTIGRARGTINTGDVLKLQVEPSTPDSDSTNNVLTFVF